MYNFDAIINQLINNEIETLDLGKANWSPDYYISLDQLKILAFILETNSSLRKLYLNCNGLNANAIESIANIIIKNPRLRTLSLAGNPIGDDGARLLADALIKNDTLHSLSLGNTQMTAVGASYIINILKIKSNITALNLSYNELGNSTIKTIADILATNQSSLKDLDLAATNIDEQGIRYIAEALLFNTKLTKLSLYSGSIRWLPITNRINDNAANLLLEALKKNIYLTTLETGIKQEQLNVYMNRNKLLLDEKNQMLKIAILFLQGSRQRTSPLHDLPIDILIILLQQLFPNLTSNNANTIRNFIQNANEKVNNHISYQLGTPFFDLWKKPNEKIIDQTPHISSAVAKIN